MRPFRLCASAPLREFLLLVCVTLTGCQSTPRVDAPQVEGPAVPSGVEAVSGASLMPDAAMTGVFVVASGENEAALRPYTLAPTAEGWSLTEPGLSETHYVRQPGGAVGLARDVNIDQDAIVWYEQPLTILPASVAGDATVTTESPTRVTNLESKGQKAAGTTALAITNIWQAPVETPAGTFEDAYHVRQQRNMDLGIAKISIVIDTAYVPGLGPVAEEVWRTEQVLIGRKQKHSRIELAEMPQPAQ